MAKGMGKKKQHDGFNNKGKPSGSGTTTQARRDRMKAKALAREAEEERLRLEEEEEEKKKEKEKEEKEKKKEEEMVVVKVELEEEKTLTKGEEEKKDLKVVEKVVEKKVEKKDDLAKKIQEKINELQAPCPKDATLQPSKKQVEQWAGQGHMIWKKKVIQKSPFDQSPCQKDSEAAASSAAASSSCQKRKKPPSSSSSAGDSSPEPFSAPEDPPCQKVELKQNPKVPDPPCQKALPEWVAIDWFQTIEVREGVWDMEALELLREARVKVWVISFAGKVQASRVFAKCDWLAREGLVDHVTIVKEKTGPQGKVALIKRRGVGSSTCLMTTGGS